MNLADYKGAKESFLAFRKIYRKKHDPMQYRKLASVYTGSAEWAMAHPETNASLTIQHLDSTINGSHIEFSPFPVSDMLMLYGSLIPAASPADDATRKIYRAEKNGGNWQSTGAMAGPFNELPYHSGNAVVSGDGQRLYFTRSRKNWQNREISEIYVSNLHEGGWQLPVKLPYPVNMESCTNTQPALGKNLRTGKDILYFVSDRPGTKGGLDIWYTEAGPGEGEYKEPRNLGRGINSPGDECCPFYDLETRTLYFSSAGREGYGGYDAYRTEGSAIRWTDAINLGKPLNTSFDDMFFSVFNKGREGFFTSNRPGTISMDNGSCCDDIFHYRINECTRITVRGLVSNSSNEDLYEQLNSRYHLNLEVPADKSPLSGIPVQLFRKEDETGTEIFLARTSTDRNGLYAFELELNRDYMILVKNYGFFDKKINLSTRNRDCNDTLVLTETGINYLPEITVRFNVYYEHDKFRLTSDAQKTIDTTLLPLIDLFPNAVIEIGSHTDSTGTDEYNIRLSQRRSESVVRHLAGKGIPEERLQARGYGESMPIAPNSNPDGTDNPAGRQLNRRTELRIIGESNLFYEDE
jgi:outer membrane protein OmpA-like peptidoglycan-associated protein